MSNYGVKRWVSLLAVIAVAVMIFLFSAQDAEDSDRLSMEKTEQIVTVVVPGYKKMPRPQKHDLLIRANHLVRKGAHFAEYALLGLTLSVHLYYALAGAKFRRIAALAWGIATLYACTDELHQMFVGGRGPAVMDVCIDSGGALTGALAGVAMIALWHGARGKRMSQNA